VQPNVVTGRGSSLTARVYFERVSILAHMVADDFYDRDICAGRSKMQGRMVFLVPQVYLSRTGERSQDLVKDVVRDQVVRS
jgi:hypothetical protein